MFAAKNRNNSKTAGTLICMPKPNKSTPLTHGHDIHDRYNFISLISDDNRKLIIGSVYLRYGRMKSIKKVKREYEDLTKAINRVILDRG